MTERDPRVNPKAGDVLRDSEGWTYEVHGIRNGMVIGQMLRGENVEGPLYCNKTAYRTMLREAKAEVIHAD